MESDFDREGNQEHEHGAKGSHRMAEKVLQESLLLIPNFLKLLYRLSKDPAVSTTDRALLAGTIGYVLLPLDFLPDMIPFLGQVDDVLLVALVVKRLMESVSHDVLEGYWDGDVRLLIWIERIIDLSRHVVPPPIYNRLVKKAHA
jgi:uncharacterized membrane protein YkvA (DUF1232 family)